MSKLRDNGLIQWHLAELQSCPSVQHRLGSRCYTLSTTGKIVYDPTRDKPDAWRCVAQVDDDIMAYYQWFFYKQFGCKLMKPEHEAHVSILRGIGTPAMLTKPWQYLEGQLVTVWYDHRLWWNKKHVWVNTYFPEYFDIRAFYEVPLWNTQLFGHLTIGRLPD